MAKRINSCAKGKRIEREACAFLTSLGFPAERGARNGVKSGADVLCPSLPNVRLEIKGVAGMDLGTKLLEDACNQAVADLPDLRMSWAVLWKPPRKDWRMTYQGQNGELPTVSRRGDISEVLWRLNKAATP